jgi:hypothetical protein
MITLANLNTKGATGGGGGGSGTALASSASQSAFDILEDHVRKQHGLKILLDCQATQEDWRVLHEIEKWEAIEFQTIFPSGRLGCILEYGSPLRHALVRPRLPELYDYLHQGEGYEASDHHQVQGKYEC